MEYLNSLADNFIIGIIAGLIAGYIVKGEKLIKILLWGFLVFLLYTILVYGRSYGILEQIVLIEVILTGLVLLKVFSLFKKKR